MHNYPLQVFVVDDDEDDRFIFNQALDETGIPIRVSHATNGLQLLDLLKKGHEQPYIIFLDINMPLLDGLKTLERIRSMEIYGETQIIIFSTSEDPDSIRLAYKLGAQLYLKKPDQYSDYVLLLEALLSGADESAVTEAFVRRG